MFRGRLAEFILHLTNLVYFCGGVVILVLGAVALGSPQSIVNVMSYIPKINNLSQIMNLTGIAMGPSIYLIVEGSLVIILSFVGCGGAFKRKIPIVLTFGIITLLMMLFNLAVIMFWFIDPYFIKSTVEYQMNQTLQSSFIPPSISSIGLISYPSNTTDASAYSWNLMQLEYSCCGVAGIDDYQTAVFNSSWYSDIGVSTALVPASCCMTNVFQTVPTLTSQFVNINGCLQSTLSAPVYLYTQGCINPVMAVVTQYNFVWSVAAAGFTGLQAIILGLTLWLLVNHHRERGGIV